MFIPHNGCRNKCSFCNQKYITGSQDQVTLDDVRSVIDKAKIDLKDRCFNSEIAFFGGSFTAIDRGYMRGLLDTAFEFIKDGSFKGIRVSTRPDAIDEEILNILKERGVSSIELGAQSMDDEVLNLNNRGHNKDDIISASMLIKRYNFSLGLQMMTGLYGSDMEKDIKTAENIAALNPDTVRIYPTIIMEGTGLSDLYKEGRYKTYSLDETVFLCGRILKIFEEKNIKVIRLGLHDSPTMKENIVSGPWHPAMRELCESQIIFEKVLNYINKNNIKCKEIVLYVNPKCVSKFIGNKKSNIKKFEQLGYFIKIKTDRSIEINDFKI